MKKLIIIPFLLVGCSTPDLDKAITSLPNYEFGEVTYYSRSNFHKTDVIATNGKIENNMLIVESLTASHHNNLFEVGAGVKDFKRPAKVTATSGTGN